MMHLEEFQAKIRSNMYAKPFRPYVVELLDGTLIEVCQPQIVMAGGHCAFISPDDELIEFEAEDVRDIRRMTAGAAS